MPLIVKWPGVTPAGSRSQHQVMIEDIFPTFLEMAGVDCPEKIDGRSFVPALRTLDGTESAPRSFFWHYPNFYDQSPHSSVMLGDYKLIYWHKSQSSVLYNLKDDIGEASDILSSNPEIASELAKLLSSHLRDCSADMPIDKKSGKPVPYPDGNCTGM